MCLNICLRFIQVLCLTKFQCFSSKFTLTTFAQYSTYNTCSVVVVQFNTLQSWLLHSIHGACNAQYSSNVWEKKKPLIKNYIIYIILRGNKSTFSIFNYTWKSGVQIVPLFVWYFISKFHVLLEGKITLRITK